MKNQNYSVLLLIAFCCFASCELDRSVKTFRNELTQSQLKNGDKEALLWGQSKDRFKKCSVENQYYDIIENNWTMTKQFTNLEAHDGLIITFNYNFINFDSSQINNSFYSTIIYDDSNTRYFKATIANGNQGCGYTGYDGKNSMTSYIPHTSSSLKIFIDAKLTGSQKLGIRDFTIQTVKCSDSNYWFSVLDGKCYCKGGYTELALTIYGKTTRFCKKN